MKFTIRDLISLTIVISLSLGWCADNRKLHRANEQLQLENLTLQFEINSLKSYPADKRRIEEIHDAAKDGELPQHHAEEILFTVQCESDFRVRVRAMAVLPLLPEREQAIDVLVAALRERNQASAGDGVVPMYAVKYLSAMKATRALPEVQAWLHYLRSEQPFEPRENGQFISRTELFIAELMLEQNGRP
ncbi:hypothetical protein ETAA8_41970 [Anatilimnocola aggregata]|uniref:HEAT repeat domain-containing protein n=1 Tax=Anatilimnocola aggregata TaxID=2528021 RepID=A0A517YFT8_9BACT|nr:hypothetical protein [Anatilimnocola aggregata]QDU29090.1 hypothetical protein ETAA8_41970 [Anatilimnocola aggregata]